MMAFSMSEPADPVLEPVTLALESRVTLGPGRQALAEQRDRISLGRPRCWPLDASVLDPAARVAAGVGSTFWLLSLTCSFRANSNEPMESAWVEVRLRTLQPPGAEQPIAWSMEPLALQDPATIEREIKVDSSLKLSSKVVPLEGGPSAGRTTTEKYEMRRPYVEAHREGTERPCWIFSRTPSTEVRGVHRLRTVVELPVGATARVEVHAGAVLRIKFLGLIPYRTPLDELPESRTALIGELAPAGDG